MPGGQGRHYLPSEWLSKRPFKVELRTLHVDRAELYRRLLGSATACGVEIVEDKVTRVNRQGNRITSVETASGIEYASRWFIDPPATLPVCWREDLSCLRLHIARARLQFGATSKLLSRWKVQRFT